MGMVTPGAPQDLILHFKQQSQINAFVETGTHLGNTAAWAGGHFSRTITMERSAALVDAIKSRFAGQSNVECIFGDCREELERVVPTLLTPAIFWLDAHWSGGVTYGEKDECPLLDEIAVIGRSKVPHLIFIDDARLFLEPPPAPHDAASWPAINEICQVLAANGDWYVCIVDDVIVRVPNKLRNSLTDFRRAQVASRQNNSSPKKPWPFRLLFRQSQKSA